MSSSPPRLLPAFSAEVFLIGINPYVVPSVTILSRLFKQAGRDKSPIPVRGTLDGHDFMQTLVKYAGEWRLYLNGPMRKAARKDVGDTVRVRIAFDPVERAIPMHPALAAALKEDPEARKVLDSLPPSRRKEVVRYIGHLKSEEAVRRNVEKAIAFLLGRQRFVGRDRP